MSRIQYDVTVRRGGFVQEFKGYEVIEKEVANGGNSARVFVPKKWAGKHVKIVLMEPIGEEPTD
ncbi:MAG: DUF2080 family transposase-associated protein [Candidatus Methanoculleus thermohydrogenotrophicum]|nr:DUF2080 family transposase-associated protein [Candidatus Methanoculleus thermohydrogenotrophicum]